MDNKKGSLVRPSGRTTTGGKRAVFLTGLLTILLIVAYMFTIKTYEPAKNIIISGGILVYPFTFLIVAFISKYYGFKEAKRSIFISMALMSIFILLIMLCILPKSNFQTSSYNTVIQYIFANDYFTIGDTRIFYPLLGQFFGLLLAFLTSHMLYAVIYKAVHEFTLDVVAMGLGTFISAIVDRLIFIPSLYLENLIERTNSIEYFIRCLTSEFIATTILCLVLIIVYSIVCKIVKSVKSKKRQLV